jgi:multiple sugar transport system permease protein
MVRGSVQRSRTSRLIAAVMVLSSARLAGAGRVERRDDGTTVIHVTLSFQVLPDFSRTDTNTRAEIAGVKAFKQRFAEIFARRYRDRYKADPDRYGRFNWDRVEVDLKQDSGIRVEGVEHDLLAIAGGMAPDVLYVNFRKSDNYIQERFLYPLDKPEDGYLTGLTKEEVDFRIHPKIWPVIWRRGPEGSQQDSLRLADGHELRVPGCRGQVWAIPFGGALGKVLLYRKDLFDAKGIPYPTNDWTWDDLLAAARKISDPTRGIYGVRIYGGKHESWNWITFLWSAGGEVMTYDANGDQWRCEFDSPEAAVALDFYTRLCAEKWRDEQGKVRRGYVFKEAEGDTKWDRGEIAMKFDYIDEKLFSTINPEVTGMAPVPLGPTGGRGAELNSRMMGLFSGIQSPVVRDAAWEYIRFYDSQEAQRIKTRIKVEGGLGRFINPKYLQMFGYPEVIRLAPKGWGEIFDIAISTGKPEPYGRNSNYAYDMMTYPMQEAEQLALAGKLPDDSAKRLAAMQGLLRRANAKANEEMIGIIPPGERRKRDAVALAVLVAIVVVFGLVFRYIVRRFTPPQAQIGRTVRWGLWRYRWAYLLLLPAAGSIFLWQYVPLARGSAMAFQDYRIIGESAWVWVRNFGDLLWDQRWWYAVLYALWYSFLVVSMTFLPPIVLAIFLQEVPRGKILFRTIFYLPAVITGLVTIILWKQFYDPSENGALNAIVTKVPAIAFLAVGLALLAVAVVFARRMRYHGMNLAAGVFVLGGLVLLAGSAALTEPIFLRGQETWRQALKAAPLRLFEATPEPYRWLGDPRTAMIACVLPMVWAGVGPGCLIYLAALKGIPEDLYEAADLDGATFIDKVLFVVFPILKPLILINFIGVFIGSWYGATGRILVMTGGGANTEVVGLYIFYKAFIFLKFGPATAMAWVLAFLLIGFTVHQLRILSRLEFRTTGAKE